MPSKKTTIKKPIAKKPAAKKIPTKPKGEDVAEMIIGQLSNIQAKLNDLNNRVSKLETLNIKSMETDNRFTKIESRLGL